MFNDSIPHLMADTLPPSQNKYTNWRDPVGRSKKISKTLTGKKLSPAHIAKSKQWAKDHPEHYTKTLVESRKGKKTNSPQAREKISKALKGRLKSKEHIQALKEAAKLRDHSQYEKAVETNRRIGNYTHTEERREKNRKSHLGLKPSMKARHKLSKTHLGFDIDIYKEEIIRLYNAGHSSKIIGKMFGTYQPTIIRNLRRWGVPIRKDGIKHGVDVSSKDGHKLLSTVELLIDNILFENGIEHRVNKQLLGTKYRYDFYLPQFDIYIEYWGLTELPAYNKNRKIKEKIYEKNELTLISIEPKDNIYKKLIHILTQMGTQKTLSIEDIGGVVSA